MWSAPWAGATEQRSSRAEPSEERRGLPGQIVISVETFQGVEEVIQVKSVQAEKIGWGGMPGLSRSQEILGWPAGEGLGAG